MALSTLPPATAPSPSLPRDLGAVERADANAGANLRALSVTQPRLAAAVSGGATGLRPVYARDGSLTAFGTDGKWWHGCSVPMAAAEAMLSSLDMRGRVACLLSPTLAAHVRVPLRRSRPDQAVIALCPDLSDLGVLLACEDLSAEISSHRLWFAWGHDWAGELRRLFLERPGLSTPAQFIRLPLTPSMEVERLVSAAQATFAETNRDRASGVGRRRNAWRRPTTRGPRICVVAPSHFRLWNDAGATLAEAWAATAAGEAEVVQFDPDDPASSSVLALLDAAESCTAIVAADTCRADLPGAAPDAMPWVTWATRPAGIPAFNAAGPDDAIVVADRSWRDHALDAGWPNERVAVGGWPTRPTPAACSSAGPRALAVVADTLPVVMPAVLEEYSSHQLLWDRIRAELTADPFALRGDPVAYLERHMRSLGVPPDGFDAAAFVEALIVPQYAQGVVRVVIAGNLPVHLFGAGWDRIDEFRHVALGPITSPAGLARVREHAAAVVDVAVVPGAHPLHRIGLPVVRPATRSQYQFLRSAEAALDGALHCAPAETALTLRQVLDLLPH